MKENLSYWERESLLGKIDNLIIGGGIVGLSCGIHLKERFPDENVTIIERAPFGLGGSTRNAGFACFGSPSEILSDLKTMSESQVIDLIRQRFDGLSTLKNLVGEKEMDYDPCGSIELFTEENQLLEQECVDSLSRLNSIVKTAVGIEPFEVCTNIQGDYGFQGVTNGISNNAEGSIHTGKMFNSLYQAARDTGVRIMHGVQVNSNDQDTLGTQVNSSIGILKAKKVFLCTNGFSKHLLDEVDVTPARNLVMITEPIDNLGWKGTFHYQEGYVYFRNVENRVLIGGGRHLDPDWQNETPPPAFIQEKLKDLLNEVVLPNRNWKIDMQWTGYLGVGKTKNPIVEEIAPNVYCGIRMGGMGVAIGTGIGKRLAELAH